ncbi:hypothetical protein HJ01_02701 [Flavobacterium frigoris PS1]|uniref:Uncharacterized protein n=1 Tax=Flavobacterium frigoris (strain PS1) TaxID=1086011 RepID=H7FUF6_FLAFP|nr:hypothetical protein HJ01_02701 [Flavobacterium frigoris PS1]
MFLLHNHAFNQLAKHVTIAKLRHHTLHAFEKRKHSRNDAS